MALSAAIGFSVLSLQAQSTSPSVFEVSTVKPSNGAVTSSSGITTGHGRITAENVTLKRCIMSAYGVGPHEIIGGPEWLNTLRFDIQAKTDSVIDDDEVLNGMLQGLLEDRFQLKVHRERKTMQAYVLEPAKDGPKLQKVEAGEANTMSSSSDSVMTLDADRISMDRFARVLARQMDHPVVNHTGLDGVYHLRLLWTPESARQPDSSAVDHGSIFSAVQEQLGLRLRSATVPVESIVIDQAAMPSEN
jgi:uncharacterized protein (TIGR03435 family)